MDASTVSDASKMDEVHANPFYLRLNKNPSLMLTSLVPTKRDYNITGTQVTVNSQCSVSEELPVSFTRDQYHKILALFQPPTSVNNSDTLPQINTLPSNLQVTKLRGCKPTSTPMVPSTKLTKQDGPHLQDAFLYRQLIGKLLYLTNTRPDICYSVQQLSQFLDAPTQTHLQAAHQILRYLLKGILGQGIFYAAKNSLHLKTFSDSD
ncbi:uncharacterized protein LOC110809387 [Carica papaya]|uniref:uncharacterized protein LOC110809387 n=1 Tax=Carica papaya TaxID=3649 RepID=UPI000B8C9EF1|nr:uncharacterized protein LOC110809387 [Carica papaya]